MDKLRAELLALKEQQQDAPGTHSWEAERMSLEEEHQIALSSMDSKFRAAQREAQTAREELKALQDERFQIEEMRQEEDRETKQRILSLESQLNGIRGLLAGGRF